MPFSPPRADRALAHQVRRVLLDADFNQSRIRALLGASDPATSPEDCLPQWRWRCRGGDPLSVLVRLFVIGDPAGYRETARALAPMTVEQWRNLGLLRRAGSRVAANVELIAQPGFTLAADPSFSGTHPARDHVLGVTTSALALNRCIIRRNARRSLDLGVGSGFLALHLAAHSEQVIGADLNPRALAFARFNAALNGVSNIEFQSSDRFAALAGRSFDLIAGNLPFVISPSRELLYRDGARGGSEFFPSVLREAPAHLNPGGYAQFLGQWSNRTELPGVCGCDVWVLRFASEPADEYATRWLLPGAMQGQAGRQRRYRQWMRFYEKQGIETIHTGLWTLRRRNAARNWQFSMDRPLPCLTWGDRLEECFRSWGRWQAVSKAVQKLDERVALSPYTVLREEYPSQTQSCGETLLLSSDGFSTPLQVSKKTRQWLALADGTRTLRRIACDSQITAVETWLAEVERLVLHGFLIFV